jgi:hypothetical protein
MTESTVQRCKSFVSRLLPYTRCAFQTTRSRPTGTARMRMPAPCGVNHLLEPVVKPLIRPIILNKTYHMRMPAPCGVNHLLEPVVKPLIRPIILNKTYYMRMPAPCGVNQGFGFGI